MPDPQHHATRATGPARAIRAATRAYGANPLHLLTLLASFAIAGYAAAHLVHESTFLRILVWFVAAVIGHDLILFPLCALADRSLGGALRALWPRRGAVARVSPLNYVRIPALGTGLLFLVFLPGIIRQGQSTYHAATGQTQQPFLDRWLLLSGAMFAVSATVYALRLRRTRPRVGNSSVDGEGPRSAPGQARSS